MKNSGREKLERSFDMQDSPKPVLHERAALHAVVVTRLRPAAAHTDTEEAIGEGLAPRKAGAAPWQLGAALGAGKGFDWN